MVRKTGCKGTMMGWPASSPCFLRLCHRESRTKTEETSPRHGADAPPTYLGSMATRAGRRQTGKKVLLKMEAYIETCCGSCNIASTSTQHIQTPGKKAVLYSSARARTPTDVTLESQGLQMLHRRQLWLDDYTGTTETLFKATAVYRV